MNEIALEVVYEYLFNKELRLENVLIDALTTLRVNGNVNLETSARLYKLVLEVEMFRHIKAEIMECLQIARSVASGR